MGTRPPTLASALLLQLLARAWEPRIIARGGSAPRAQQAPAARGGLSSFGGGTRGGDTRGCRPPTRQRANTQQGLDRSCTERNAAATRHRKGWPGAAGRGQHWGPGGGGTLPSCRSTALGLSSRPEAAGAVSERLRAPAHRGGGPARGTLGAVVSRQRGTSAGQQGGTAPWGDAPLPPTWPPRPAPAGSPGHACASARAARLSSWASPAPASPPCSGSPRAPLPPASRRQRGRLRRQPRGRAAPGPGHGSAPARRWDCRHRGCTAEGRAWPSAWPARQECCRHHQASGPQGTIRRAIAAPARAWAVA